MPKSSVFVTLFVLSMLMLDSAPSQAREIKYNWSVANTCKNLFLEVSEVDIHLAHTPLLDVIYQPQVTQIQLDQLVPKNASEARVAFSRPRLVIVGGDPQSGKTTAINQGLFPFLHRDGYSVASISVQDFAQLVKTPDTAEKNLRKLLRYDILAIDNFRSTALSYDAYKDAVALVRARVEKGLSTFVILDTTQEEDELVEFLDAAVPHYYTPTSGDQKPVKFSYESIGLEHVEGMSREH